MQRANAGGPAIADLALNLATAITLARAACGPVVAAIVASGEHRVAFWLFLVAIASDFVDGWVARATGSPPWLGAWLDPLCDKALTMCTWGAIVAYDLGPSWLGLSMILRDTIVIALWVFFRLKGRRVDADEWGQIAVAYEGTALAILLFHDPWLDVRWPLVGTVIGILALTLSIAGPVRALSRR